ncbi:thiamine phosphate synthase [Pseudorhodobacter aquimaris]|uniref:thiamine phosphate synthase n=1 Tax=Pseudorhodobacter aquimaris TaxID=687412 RepID=UPI00067BB498|nr:thiamine phosphate synthase [Pseudorhodobacter aquimaris]
MVEAERPQIYLITPPVFELGSFTEQLKSVLDTHEIACLRLSLAERDEDSLSRAGDALREVAHARDVPIVVENHVLLAGRLGLDGVHLTDTRKSIRKMRDEMGADAIIGAFCGVTRHDGMNAAEAGADYISFGPVGDSTLGDGSSVDFELFEWWSAMIEVPVVAEGALTVELVEKYGPVTDFFGIGSEIWATENASDALKALLQPLG